MDGYVAFLVLGVALVLIDGQLIYRSGRGYLREVYRPDVARSMIQLVTVLFHLVVLGLLALISLLDVDTGLPVRDVVVKLGVVLLVLAVAHGLTLTILVQIRDRRRREQISDEMADNLHHRVGNEEDSVPPTVESSENAQHHRASQGHW